MSARGEAARFRRRRLSGQGIVWLGAAALLLTAGSLRAQELVRLDPARTTIGFTLGATMHTVHGAFKLKSGEIRFNPATGKASGAIVVDATSGNTENGSRDKKMHRDVLESSKYSEIVFRPERVEGTLAAEGTSEVKVAGLLWLHGQDHAVALDLKVERSAGGDLTVSTKFPVPFVSWGLKDPSSFLLRVDKIVNVEVHAAGRMERAAP
ncbi:MAG TPA: YceI family protein [Candidatus Acidoferrales bacterium]|nr:YceI family protein [Candidatus Acidoferrales bacterium]